MGTRRAIWLVTALAIAVAVVVAATPQDVRTIAPGMSEAQVIDVFGQPQGKSAYGDFAYYFYNNGCEEECGFPDFVVFRNGQVVDAVLRAPWHAYSGESSSPKGTIPRPTPGGETLQMPTEVQGVEVRPAEVPPAEMPTPRVLDEKPDTTSGGG